MQQTEPLTQTTEADTTPSQVLVAERTACSCGAIEPAHNQQRTRRQRAVTFAVVMLTTIQVLYFYIVRVPPYLLLGQYEQGMERMPFQGRLLMRYPLLWAHNSAAFARAAHWLTVSQMWLGRTIQPEDVLEFCAGIVAVAVAGWVTTKLYRKHSATGRLHSYVYPVFLLMVAITYCLVSMNFFRYVYDLPGLCLFAAALYFLYVKEWTLPFAAAFIVATLNRETSIFLLPLFLQHRCLPARGAFLSRLLTLRTGGVALCLGLYWLAFHLWLAHRFGAPPPGIKPGILVNLNLLVWPYAWPQLFAIGAYTLPLLLCFRPERLVNAGVFRWMAVLPLCGAVMLVYGSLVEVRLFGEFLPLFASTAVLVVEEQLFAEHAHVEPLTADRSLNLP